jgi:hypothetical protein
VRRVGRHALEKDALALLLKPFAGDELVILVRNAPA